MLLHSTIKSIRAANDVSSHRNAWWRLKQGIAPIMQCSRLSQCVVFPVKNLCSWIKTFCHFRCPFRDSHTINWIKINSSSKNWNTHLHVIPKILLNILFLVLTEESQVDDIMVNWWVIDRIFIFCVTYSLKWELVCINWLN